ncbi:unnamed protein product, partial [Rotaria magnacalcarata]
TPILVTSQYSSELTETSGQFCRDGDCSSLVYYYEAFNFNVSAAGSYTFISSSSMDTFGYLYKNSFYSYAPAKNVIAADNDSAGDAQFRLHTLLDTVTAYVLVVTTFKSNVNDSYSIIITDVASIALTPIGALNNGMKFTSLK